MKNKFNEQTPQFRLKSKRLPLKKGAILKRLGFTLVELLVVISIMGVLTVIVSASFRTIQMKSRDARRKSDINSIYKALNMYYNDIGTFPHGITDPDIDGMIKAVGVGFSANVNGMTTVYMAEVPRETTQGVEDYKYTTSDTGKSFKLFINLENSEDNDCLKEEDGDIMTMVGTIYSVDTGCIYGVSSSNIKIMDNLL